MLLPLAPSTRLKVTFPPTSTSRDGELSLTIFSRTQTFHLPPLLIRTLSFDYIDAVFYPLPLSFAVSARKTAATPPPSVQLPAQTVIKVPSTNFGSTRTQGFFSLSSQDFPSP